MKRHTLLVTPYVERALRLTAHLKAQGIDVKVVTRHAVQVDPEQADRAYALGTLFVKDQEEKERAQMQAIHEQEEKTRAMGQGQPDVATWGTVWRGVGQRTGWPGCPQKSRDLRLDYLAAR